MSVWVSVTGEIHSLSEQKSAVTELACFGSADSSEQFVQHAKVLIASSSALVQLLANQSRELGAENATKLSALANQFSLDCISFVHAARGFLFDKDNAKERFHDSSKRLDERLETLLDVVLELMNNTVSAKSPRRPPPPPPHVVSAISSVAKETPEQKEAKERPALGPPPMPPRRPSANENVIVLPTGPPPPLPKKPSESPRRRPSDLSIVPGDPRRVSTGWQSADSSEESRRLSSSSSSPRMGRRDESAADSSSPCMTRRPDPPSDVPVPEGRRLSSSGSSPRFVRRPDPPSEVPTPPVGSPRQSPAPPSFSPRPPDEETAAPRSPRKEDGIRKEDSFQGSGSIPKSPRLAMLFSSSSQKLMGAVGAEPKIHKCAASNDLEGMKKILSKTRGRDLNLKNSKGLTALQVSIQNRCEVMALLLISSGASLESEQPHLSPALLAAQFHMLGVCELMLDRGLAPTARMAELIFCHPPTAPGIKLVERIAKGVDVNKQNKYGDTLLHVASGGGWTDAVSILVNLGADKNAKNLFGETPLHRAARVGSAECVVLLKQLGCDESVVGDSGTAAAVAHASVRHLLAKVPESSASSLERGRAVTMNLHYMGQSQNDLWNSLEQLDHEVKKLAVHSVSPKPVGVFEDYQGAMFELEMGKRGVAKSGNFVLDTEEDWFRALFFGKPCFFYTTKSWGKGEIAILTVLANADEEKGTFCGLLVSGSGFQKLDLSLRVEGVSAKTVRKEVEAVWPRKWAEVGGDNSLFASRLLELETLHSRNANNFRIAVVFGRSDQKSEAEMFCNRENSPEFELFLSLLGDKVELRGWGGYAGGLNQEDAVSCPHVLVTKWRGLNICFHVSTAMTPEQQRRLIGNDIAMVFFYQGAGEEAPSFPVAMRGNVNSVAAVVVPAPNRKYRLGVFRRGNIKQFDPPLPEDPVFAHDEIKDFLLAKLVNGEIQTHKSPPLSQLHARVLSRALSDLVQSANPTK